MATSARFKYLQRRIVELEERFLPITFSPTGNYSKKQQDLARAYRLLVHSEIESYIEEQAKAKAISAVKKWKERGVTSNVLVSLLAFHYNTSSSPPNTITNNNNAVPSTSYAVDKALSAYIHEVKESHGVRERNLLKILYPIGIQQNDLDTTWVNALDSFGERRGEVAHNSIRAQQAIDPQNEKNTVANLMTGLLDLDEKFRQIK